MSSGYDLLRENAELRKMTNSSSAHLNAIFVFVSLCVCLCGIGNFRQTSAEVPAACPDAVPGEEHLRCQHRSVCKGRGTVRLATPDQFEKSMGRSW